MLFHSSQLCALGRIKKAAPGNFPQINSSFLVAVDEMQYQTDVIENNKER